MTDASGAPVQALDDLLALAAVLEEQAAERYEALAGSMQARDNGTVAALFDALAREERKHYGAVHDLAGGAITDQAKDRWRSWLASRRDETETLPLSPSAYQALAFAVRNEERTFRHYSYIAAQASDPTVIDAAEALAQEELTHAALLRRARRRAFHAARSERAQYRPADRELPLTQEALCLAALTRERSLLSLIDAFGVAAADLGSLRTATANLLEQLRETAKTLDLPGDPSPTPPARHRDARAPQPRRFDLQIALDRAFELYDQVADRTSDENALALAQVLAAATTARLRLLSGDPTETR